MSHTYKIDISLIAKYNLSKIWNIEERLLLYRKGIFESSFYTSKFFNTHIIDHTSWKTNYEKKMQQSIINITLINVQKDSMTCMNATMLLYMIIIVRFLNAIITEPN